MSPFETTSLEPVFIGIGSNLDGPAQRVRAAIDALAELPGCHRVVASPLYGSRPMRTHDGPSDQPDYVNAVACLHTEQTPHALLDALQELERAAGRVRDGERWGPRVLDLDLLVFGDRRIADARLQVPHPGVAERAFVLRPLADLAPALEIPGSGRVDALLQALAVTDLWPLADAHA